MASSNQPRYHMLNTTPCWSTMKYEVATGTVTGGLATASSRGSCLTQVRITDGPAAAPSRPERSRFGGARARPVRPYPNPCNQGFFNLNYPTPAAPPKGRLDAT